MIKVDLLEKEIDKTTVLYFESRLTDDDSLSELDRLYEILVSSLSKVMVAGGYDNSHKFFIEVHNPS